MNLRISWMAPLLTSDLYQPLIPPLNSNRRLSTTLGLPHPLTPNPVPGRCLGPTPTTVPLGTERKSGAAEPNRVPMPEAAAKPALIVPGACPFLRVERGRITCKQRPA